MYVTGSQYNQVSGYKIDNNTGNLSLIQGSPYGSGGTNPVDAFITAGGRFLYVLNAGCADPTLYPNAKFPCTGSQQPTASSISVFTIGGSGVLSFQQSYPSIGNNSVSMLSDSGGNFLYVLDQNVPQVSTTPSQYLADGDVSVFSLDSVTGRLSLVQNQQVNDNSGNPLSFFPVGVGPVWFTLFSSNLYTIDRFDGADVNPTYVSVYSAPSTGQLTATQNSEFQTGATDLTYIYGKSSYLYLLDAGTPNDPSSPLYNGQLLTYTASSSGALAAITGGGQLFSSSTIGYSQLVYPSTMVVETQGKFLYVAGQGLNTGLTSPGSLIASLQIISNGTVQAVGGVNGGSINSSVGSGPRCILEDPSNQFLYTANYNDSTISGFVINTQAGILSLQRTSTSKYTAPGKPTWCVSSGTTF
jgi:6-phosphogluconolactonase (cycloisomerase 2 family)